MSAWRLAWRRASQKARRRNASLDKGLPLPARRALIRAFCEALSEALLRFGLVSADPVSMTEREVKGGAFAFLTLGPDAPPMALDHALHCSQADARALKLRPGVQPLKRLE